jgi:hypothetical protein
VSSKLNLKQRGSWHRGQSSCRKGVGYEYKANDLAAIHALGRVRRPARNVARRVRGGAWPLSRPFRVLVNRDAGAAAQRHRHGVGALTTEGASCPLSRKCAVTHLRHYHGADGFGPCV